MQAAGETKTTRLEGNDATSRQVDEIYFDVGLCEQESVVDREIDALAFTSKAGKKKQKKTLKKTRESF
jgi:hypothetical protein